MTFFRQAQQCLQKTSATCSERISRSLSQSYMAMWLVLERLVPKVDGRCGCLQAHCWEKGIAAAVHMFWETEGRPFVLTIDCEAHAGGAVCEVCYAAHDIPLQVTYKQLGLHAGSCSG